MNPKTLRAIMLVWPVGAFALTLYGHEEFLATLWGGIMVGVFVSRFLEWRMSKHSR
jgi:hypothetical protein